MCACARASLVCMLFFVTFSVINISVVRKCIPDGDQRLVLMGQNIISEVLVMFGVKCEGGEVKFRIRHKLVMVKFGVWDRLSTMNGMECNQRQG